MKQTVIILLLSLLSFPIIWNGISMIHFVVEHTHTFCHSETEHSHSNPDNCLSIFQLSESHNQNQLPSTTKIDFQELKQYLNPHLVFNSILPSAHQQNLFVDTFLLEHLFSNDVFQPPILS